MEPFAVPAELSFAGLQLALEPDGQLSFDPDALEQIALANGLPREHFMRSQALAAELIVRWYGLHRQAGGPPDPVAEQLIRDAGSEL